MKEHGSEDSLTLSNPQEKVVNNFSILFGTVNGSGSATANMTLLRALFRMGIPVSGKNILPSNIQGLPTWYSIRVNKDGNLAREEKSHIVVAMNLATFNQDIQELVPGGALYYSDDIKVEIPRKDIHTYAMPITKLAKESDTPPRLLNYIKNMVYIGILAHMLGVNLEAIREALDLHFESKQVAVESNYRVIVSAVEWAKNNLQKKDPYFVEPMNGTHGCVLTDGNKAAALGAIFGGVQFAAWYPITPATSLAERLDEFIGRFRKDPETGKQNYAVVQAEDEISAIGMAVGAGWGGLRSMTSTSGPGISLMAEYIGLSYFAEIPVVVWDVQRMGPSTGLPTRTSQGDITFANFLGHGDTNYLMLFPGNMPECFDFSWQAFDLAEKYQTPVLVLSDMDLGMNQWMSPELQYPDAPMDRGKILWEDELAELLQERDGDWGRYLDIDGDGIPYRTVIGNRHPRSGYFSRGTGHDEYASYSEDPDVWERMMARMRIKFKNSQESLPKPVFREREGARFGIITVGSPELAVIEAISLLAEEGVHADYMRIRAKPFHGEVVDFIRKHDYCYVVETNDEGQIMQLLILEAPECAYKLRKMSKNNGKPISAEYIVGSILSKEKDHD